MTTEKTVTIPLPPWKDLLRVLRYDLTNQRPLRTGVMTRTLGRVSVYEDPVHGDMETLVVVDADGNQFDSDCFDIEDLKAI